MMPRPVYHHFEMEHHQPPKDVEEKRAKREIANMNERRRMQNINAGFHSLRTLLPQKHEGEKLSKAAILQHTATYIYRLESEISKLLQQISELKQAAGVGGGSSSSSTNNANEWMARLQSQPPDCPSCKRRKYDQHHRLDIDSSSPINGEEMGSSTDSSSEAEIGKYSARNRKQPTTIATSATNPKGLSEAALLRKQLHRLERELIEERRLRTTLEDELHHQGGRTPNTNGSGRQSRGLGDEGEVVGESIEIEMHSCPASPPEMMIAGNEAGSFYTSNHFPLTGQNNNNHQSSLVIGDEQQQQHNQRVQHSKQQNAIALPIDVPFVTHDQDLMVDKEQPDQQIRTAVSSSRPKLGANGSVVVVVESKNFMLVESAKKNNNATSSSSSEGGGQPQILQLVPKSVGAGPTNGINAQQLIAKLSANGGGSSSNSNSSLKQPKPGASPSLQTIVEAIRHLEGDFMAQQQQQQQIKEEPPTTTTTTTTTKTIVANNSGTTQRPQIIQIQRPNVIVANSVDN